MEDGGLRSAEASLPVCFSDQLLEGLQTSRAAGNNLTGMDDIQPRGNDRMFV